MLSATRGIGIGSALAVVAAGVMWMAHRGRTQTPARERGAGPAPATENAHLGSESCSRCHPGEAFRHARSGHARTLAPARKSAAARHLAGSMFRDDQRGITFHYRLDEDGLTVTVPERLGDEFFPLDWAFGSGEHATTFLTLIPNRVGETVGIEHRVSVFAPDHHSGLTPSHAGLEPTQDVEQFGRVIRGPKLEACIGCHTTSAPAGKAAILERQANVGCERCHGPGAPHLQAVEEKRDDLAVLFGRGNHTAEEQIRLCGQCHRHPEALSETRIGSENPRLARFQPVGLLQSACYKKSGGQMSCTTCHDPHEHVAQQRGEFEGRCVRCHAPDGSQSAPCRVSPAANCIACHMPEIEVRPGTAFHDHWIRIHAAPGR